MIRVRRRGELVLAPIAGAGVDVANGERRTGPAVKSDPSPQPVELAEKHEHRWRTSAISARVAELEALVDEGELGDEAVRGNVRDGRPVGIRAGPQFHSRA